MSTINDLRNARIEKLQKLKGLGINPYPAKSQKDANNSEIVESFDSYKGKKLNLTGRVISNREHGNIVFMDISDQTGKIQLFVSKDNLQEKTNSENQTLGMENINLIDVGDFIEAKGKVTKTKSGEVSLEVIEIKMLAKSIRPFPDKHEGLKDKETRFRKRYLDLVVNPYVREMFNRKSLFWKYARDFMYEKGFVEVETPVLELVTGGADAAPFVTHHNALDQDFYLRISTELYLKRLVGGGYEKVFTLGPNFRNEGIDDEHLQEYYQLEWYWAYADYKDNMKLVEELYRYLAKKVYQTTKFERKGMEFDLSDEWKKIDYVAKIKEKLEIDIFTDSEEKMLQGLEKSDIKISGDVGRNRIVDNLWKIVRKTITGPAFLVNIPKFISPLAKSTEENENVTERFQPIIAGSELGNGYSELNDPFDQLDRFLEQQSARDAGDDEAQMLDIDFVEMLEYGMPPTSGYGMSERLFWFLENVTAREGTLFPQMKHKIDSANQKIYGIEEREQQSELESATDREKAYNLPSREEALEKLQEHVDDMYQIMHAQMVANVMEAYAKELGENEDLWYLTGLLHDVDYFEHPKEHPKRSLQWLEDWGYPEELIHAVAAHAIEEPRISPKTNLAAALIAVDELTGLLYAYSLMRPEGFTGMKAKSIKKKFKDKAFAAKVDRDEILYGMQKFGVEFSDHVLFVAKILEKMESLLEEKSEI